MFRRFLLWVLVLACWCEAQVPVDCRQCLVGVAGAWNESKATLTWYEKTDQGWQQVGESWSARLGRDGMAWGLGLHPVPKGAQAKREGDWRSPAGIFAIGGVWGYDKSIRKCPALPYHRITARDLWIEDATSRFYNQHVVLDHDPATEWEKKQQMKQGDHAHSLKLFIAHNASPKVVPGAGSSIFFHIWREGGSKPTAGCTTMEEAKLRWLIARIDPAQRPIYVLLPKAEYEKRRVEWKLP